MKISVNSCAWRIERARHELADRLHGRVALREQRIGRRAGGRIERVEPRAQHVERALERRDRIDAPAVDVFGRRALRRERGIVGRLRERDVQLAEPRANDARERRIAEQRIGFLARFGRLAFVRGRQRELVDRAAQEIERTRPCVALVVDIALQDRDRVRRFYEAARAANELEVLRLMTVVPAANVAVATFRLLIC